MYVVIKRPSGGKTIRECNTVSYSIDAGETWMTVREFNEWKETIIKVVPLYSGVAHVLYGDELEKENALYRSDEPKTRKESCQQIVNYYIKPEKPLTLWGFLKFLIIR